MKLVVANNQSQQFRSFHQDLQAGEALYDYTGYKSLLFEFGLEDGKKILAFVNVDSKKRHSDYTAAYLTGYLHTPELAITTATIFSANNLPFVNSELAQAPSLSKLSQYATLAHHGVQIPHTFAGTAYALREGGEFINLSYPLVLKRADADRGIDNYKVKSYQEVQQLLKDQDEFSLWILQSFVPNDGFYLVSLYHNQPTFGIYRSLETRPDGNEQKAHMFKPKGGANASLIDIADLPEVVVATSLQAALALRREIASVDSLYVPATNTAYVLEVNYNPQLVTIETLKEMRREAFLKAMRELGE